MQFPDSLLEAADAVRRGTWQIVDLVEACLARIEALDGRLRAWVLVDAAGARHQARRLADELAAGADRGPLHGIPVAIKDIVDVAGMPTKAGSPLRENHRAATDAPLVGRLRQAGAVILGKTVTTEWASFDPPPTRNPWNLQRTPGGSSSGSAAAVAAGMCLGAIGSQTGGSITRPASFCGIAGCKPTYGLVDARGVVPLAPSMDHPGPMARRVGDLAAMLQALAGPDEEDPFAVRPAACDYLSAAGHRVPRWRVGVLEDFESLADPQVRRATRAALDRWQQAGAEMISTRLPQPLIDVLRAHRIMMAVEAAQVHREDFPRRREQYGPNIAGLIDEGHRASGLEYAAALGAQRAFRRQMVRHMNDFDVLVSPSTVTPAPGPETTGDPRMNSPWSFCGLPTVSVPCGLSDDGLPVSLQLAGPPWREGQLLAAAAHAEAAVDFRSRPPLDE